VSVSAIDANGNAVLLDQQLSVLERDLTGRSCELILGRDVLCQSEFFYDGKGNNFTIEF
jgi:hypothetical protein